MPIQNECDGNGPHYGDTQGANIEAITSVPKLLRENEQLKLQNEKFESLLYKISRSVCLDQKLSGKCLCFSCEAKAALGVKKK